MRDMKRFQSHTAPRSGSSSAWRQQHTSASWRASTASLHSAVEVVVVDRVAATVESDDEDMYEIVEEVEETEIEFKEEIVKK